MSCDERRERERREKRTTNVPAWTGLYRKCTLCCALAVAGDAHGEEKQDGHTVSLSDSALSHAVCHELEGRREKAQSRGRTEGGREGREGEAGGLVLDENIREAAMGSRS